MDGRVGPVSRDRFCSNRSRNNGSVSAFVPLPHIQGSIKEMSHASELAEHRQEHTLPAEHNPVNTSMDSAHDSSTQPS